MGKLDRIATFIAVVENNGFAAAARIKNVSTAAISRQVTTLENELGVQLLQRTTRQLSLTPIGQKYFQQCKQALAALNETEMEMMASHQEASGTLHIVANRYFAITHILPRLAEFNQQNPNLRIHFQLAERFPDFQKEEVDILFGISIEGSDTLIRKRVATTRYILCASPAYLKQHGTPEKSHDLYQHQYITHSIRRPDNVITFKDGQEVQLEPALWLNDSYAMRECALQNMGIVNLHDYMVTDLIAEKKLIEVLPHSQESRINVYLYYQQNHYLQPKIRKFIDFFTAN